MRICISLTALLAVLSLVGPARAHIDSVDPAPRHVGALSGLKAAPCGMEGSEPGETVHTYQPGEIIELTIQEAVPHPGYMRIAFDVSGDDDFVDPRSIDPSLELPNGGRACEEGEDPSKPGVTDHCGQPDFCNNNTVLLDNLDAVAVGQGGLHRFQVKLPDLECDECTLQIIQIMTDIAGSAHGYYEPDSPQTVNNYYECIDIRLVHQDKDAASFGEQSAQGDSGIRCGMDALPDNNMEPLESSTVGEDQPVAGMSGGRDDEGSVTEASGCALSRPAGGSGVGSLALLGLLLVLRRRRRRQ